MPRVNEPPQVLQILQIIHKRRGRRAAARNALPKRVLRASGWALAGASVVAALLALGALPFYNYITAGLPVVDSLEQMLDPQTGSLLQPARFYDRSGEELLFSMEAPNAPRKFIQAGDAPWLAAAFVASSDPAFWQHNGALWTYAGAEAHTIAERLVANLLVAQEPEGWKKAIRMRALASEITTRFGRAQVLTWAMNSARFGNWTFGAESAAQFYFGKPASQLSLAEAAVLAAVAQVPEVNPADAPEAALQLGHLVLIAMREQARVSDDEFNSAISEQIVVTAQPLAADAFAALTAAQLHSALGDELAERGGLEVITTLDLTMQQELQGLISEGSAVVLDPVNGRVLAMTGSQQAVQTDNVLLPFIYLDAFASGASPASLTWNLGEPASAGLLAGPVSMRTALANGLKTPAEELVRQLGANRVAQVLQATGLASFRRQLSDSEASFFAFGEASVSPVETASAYGSLSNLGNLSGKSINGEIEASAILFVTDSFGQVVLDWSRPDQLSIASPELAYLVTDSLSDVSVRAGAERELITQLGRPTALAPSGDPSWMIGYSPQRVVVLHQSNVDVVLWAQVYAAAHRGLPIQSWQAPGGLSSVNVCVPSGFLPDADCPETRRELFTSGSEPRFADGLYIRLAVNSLNGLLATVFTPEEFVQERVFLDVPMDLQSWARAAGLTLAPTDYDTIPALNESADLVIATPPRFGEVSGMITIRSEIGADVAGWDLQAGEGLYPSQWLEIAAGDASQEVTARWHTSGLSGLWALQLQAWDSAGNVTRAFTVVTVGD